ncbi:MAG: retron St85 family RNA-directed DNA polymerase [Dyella sp.]|uniref:retron St85 family RNA-directed DNA polymerase n=1 Tax=Dyella sp. TaxID=1869338 RepID=UPI003F7CE482
MSAFIDQVAALVGLPKHVCVAISKTAHRRYKVFYIPKQDGKRYREVAQPAREVKALQRAIVHLISPKLPIHRSATAYREGVSLRANAIPHIAAKFITKLDLVSFFPSIDRTSLGRFLRSSLSDCDNEDVGFILSTCCWTPRGTTTQRLCIGAPSSPMLSNAIMYPFDEAFALICREAGAVYTRYSDDICLSAVEPNVLHGVESRIRAILAQSRWPVLQVNEAKRVAVGRGTSMQVTGLTLANQGMVTVGRLRKRGVRAGVKRYFDGLLSVDEIAKLRGELAFVLSIEPGFRFVLLKTYGLRINDLISAA